MAAKIDFRNFNPTKTASIGANKTLSDESHDREAAIRFNSQSEIVTEETNQENKQFKLYSISSATRLLAVGKDTLYKLISEGRVRVIKIGKRYKISHMELVRFQSENSIEKPRLLNDKLLTTQEIEKIFFNKNRDLKLTLKGNEILESIMRGKKWQL